MVSYLGGCAEVLLKLERGKSPLRGLKSNLKDK